jgi:hypothetical protein
MLIRNTLRRNGLRQVFEVSSTFPYGKNTTSFSSSVSSLVGSLSLSSSSSSSSSPSSSFSSIHSHIAQSSSTSLFSSTSSISFKRSFSSTSTKKDDNHDEDVHNINLNLAYMTLADLEAKRKVSLDSSSSISSSPKEEKEKEEEKKNEKVTRNGEDLLLDPSLVSSRLPHEISAELDRYIIGQTEAKRAVAIALSSYLHHFIASFPPIFLNHLPLFTSSCICCSSSSIGNRWRRRQLPESWRREIIPTNILMIGPTGVGKVHFRLLS